MYMFVHIPKCGGTTFNHILKRTFCRKNVLHYDTQDEARAFNKLSPEKLNKYTVIGGHTTANHYISHNIRDRTFLCLIRSAVQHVLFFYKDVRHSLGHHLSDWAQDGPEVFLKHIQNKPNRFLKLRMCTSICGENCTEKPWDMHQEYDIRIADLEQFDDFYAYLLKKVRWEKKNVHHNTPKPNLSSEFLSKLNDIFSEDILLRNAILLHTTFKVDVSKPFPGRSTKKS